MTKVWCPCVECVHNDYNRCKAKELKFKYRNMATVNEGRVDMWVCDQYMIDKQSQEIMVQMDALLKEKGLI
jgi:hypothetical protein